MGSTRVRIGALEREAAELSGACVESRESLSRLGEEHALLQQAHQALQRDSGLYSMHVYMVAQERRYKKNRGSRNVDMEKDGAH